MAGTSTAVGRTSRIEDKGGGVAPVIATGATPPRPTSPVQSAMPRFLQVCLPLRIAYAAKIECSGRQIVGKCLRYTNGGTLACRNFHAGTCSLRQPRSRRNALHAGSGSRVEGPTGGPRL